ncbi:hypothetical protein PL321_07120 [Caloramator sp. mosi_1]|nr:hypothetical protein [Caloramator sp. mosi_1]WDC85225.1 hypothetical protein PL321_07120 [Caloramator sp. mosi_1]
MGNPQNLFLYSKFNINTIEFFKIMLPFVIMGFVLLGILNLKIPNKDIVFHIEEIEIKSKKRRLYLYFYLFLSFYLYLT